jgi:hypothetical protein
LPLLLAAITSSLVVAVVDDASVAFWHVAIVVSSCISYVILKKHTA